jgi:AcrR family transcriptional regulator
VRPQPNGYTGEVQDPTPSRGQPSSLRAEQVAQTRAALIAAGRHLFGRDGFADTSVEDLAREARVTIGALYHHFPTKAALFETVFEALHAELLTASARAAQGASDEIELLTLGTEAFLDAVLQPDIQRIIIIDAPAVLGLVRFTELDERYAFAAISAALEAAAASGKLRARDPATLARLLLGAMTRGAMLIAGSPEPAQTRHAVAMTFRDLLGGLAVTPPGAAGGIPAGHDS